MKILTQIKKNSVLHYSPCILLHYIPISSMPLVDLCLYTTITNCINPIRFYKIHACIQIIVNMLIHHLYNLIEFRKTLKFVNKNYHLPLSRRSALICQNWRHHIRFLRRTTGIVVASASNLEIKNLQLAVRWKSAENWWLVVFLELLLVVELIFASKTLFATFFTLVFILFFALPILINQVRLSFYCWL